jgi:UPF0716 protein FxsA
MLMLLIALFILVPLLEITVIVEVAHAVGGWNTIGALLLISVVGAWLVRREGFAVLRSIGSRLDAGQLPGRELVDGVLVLAAGVLMLTPGFVTDLFGLLLLFPPTRAIARALLVRRFGLRVRRVIGGDGVIDV